MPKSDLVPVQGKVCCLLATVSVIAVSFVFQSKRAKQWLLALQQRHINSLHIQMFSDTDFVRDFTLQYRSITLETENY